MAELSAVARTSLAAMDAGLINLRQEAQSDDFEHTLKLANAVLAIAVQLGFLEDDLRQQADDLLRERVDASVL